MKQPKYAALFLAGTLAFGGIAPSTIVNAETTEDVTAPDAPVLSAPLHTSTALTITGEVAAKAEILINGKTYVRKTGSRSWSKERITTSSSIYRVQRNAHSSNRFNTQGTNSLGPVETPVFW